MEECLCFCLCLKIAVRSMCCVVCFCVFCFAFWQEVCGKKESFSLCVKKEKEGVVVLVWCVGGFVESLVRVVFEMKGVLRQVAFPFCFVLLKHQILLI